MPLISGRFAWMWRGNCGRWLLSFSYTHLDVYKRQAYGKRVVMPETIRGIGFSSQSMIDIAPAN